MLVVMKYQINYNRYKYPLSPMAYVICHEYQLGCNKYLFPLIFVSCQEVSVLYKYRVENV